MDYTADYVIKDMSERQKINQKIEKLKQIKRDLVSEFGEIDGTKYTLMLLDCKIEDLKRMYDEKLEDGVYIYEYYSRYPTKVIETLKRVEGDCCDECVFKEIPCLGIRSSYGCHTTPDYSPNNDERYGKLVKTGHFIQINKKIITQKTI